MADCRDNFLKSLLSYREWRRSLQIFLLKPKVLDRFSLSDKHLALSLSELFYDEAAFFKLFASGVTRGDFSIALAQERFLPTKTKKRKIHSFPLFDTFVYEHAARVLLEETKKYWNEAMFGHRKGRSDALAVSKVLEEVHAGTAPIWIVRKDVKDFGLSVPHGKILDLLGETLGLGGTSLAFLRTLLAFPYQTEDGTAHRNSLGSPTGTSFQHVLGNFYLHDLDAALEKIADMYLRFGDDILVLSGSIEKAETALAVLNRMLKEKGLQANEKKSAQLVMRGAHTDANGTFRAARSFEYLGRTVCEDGAVLRPRDKFIEIKRSIDHYLARTGAVLGTETIAGRTEALCEAMRILLVEEHFADSATIKAALWRIQSEKHLKDFDRWIAVTLLKHVFRKPFTNSLLRRVSISQLRRYGLPSIRHIKHTHVVPS